MERLYIHNSTITLIDAKTQLQEHSLKCLKFCLNILFTKKKDLNTIRYLKQMFKFPIQKKISGEGASKKNAQQNAANKLLKILKII